ncbi:MAG: hypothetical protein AAGB51_10075 [Planctomycetota bacterium]
MDHFAMRPDMAGGESGRLDPDAICPRCGYGLGGMDISSLCPECASPAILAREPDRFRNGPANVVIKQARGISKIFWGNVATTAAPFLMIAMAIAGGAAGAAADSGPAAIGGIAGAMFIGGGIALVGMIAVLWGWWQITTEQPAIESPASRGLIRFGMIAMFLAMLAIPAFFMFSAGAINAGGAGAAQAGGILMLLVVAAVGIGSIVFFFATLCYLKWIASRVPNDSLASFIGHCMWAMPVSSVLGVIIPFVGLIAPVMYLIALGWMNKTLGAEIRTAREETIAAYKASKQAANADQAPSAA